MVDVGWCSCVVDVGGCSCAVDPWIGFESSKFLPSAGVQFPVASSLLKKTEGRLHANRAGFDEMASVIATLLASPLSGVWAAEPASYCRHTYIRMNMQYGIMYKYYYLLCVLITESLF